MPSGATARAKPGSRRAGSDVSIVAQDRGGSGRHHAMLASGPLMATPFTSLPNLLGHVPGPEGLRLELEGKSVSLSETETVAAYFRARTRDDSGQRLLTNFDSDATRARGVRLLESSEMEFERFEPFALSLPLSWDENPSGDRSWAFELHCLTFVNWLLSVHLRGVSGVPPSGDTRHPESGSQALSLALEVACDWQAKNEGQNPPSEFSWHDHATARRLDTLLTTFEFARHLREPVLFAGLLRSVLVHARALSVDSFYSKHTNHGVEQARVLYRVARMLPEAPESEAWRECAVQRLRSEFEHAFVDGVHVENSPGYHQVVTGFFLDVRRGLTPADEARVFDDFGAFIRRSMRFLTHVVRPDGRLPIIGDSQHVLIHDCFQEFADTKEYQQLRYALSFGKEGLRPEEHSVYFGETGYVTFRNAWPESADFSQAVHAVFKSGYLSGYHRHQDDLSFVLHGYGEDWVVDGGMHSYNESDPIRIHLRRAAAHNVPLVNAEVERDVAKQKAGSRVRSYEASADGVRVFASSGLYAGVTVSRQLHWKSQGSITIVDRASGAHTVRFHVPRDKELRVEADGFVASSPRTGAQMTVRSIGAKPKTVQLTRTSRTGKVSGITSKRFRRIEDVRVLDFVFEAVQESVLELSLHAAAPAEEPVTMPPESLPEGTLYQSTTYSPHRGQRIRVRATEIKNEVGNAYFLEHVYDIRSRQATKEVIFCRGMRVMYSKDLGVTWKKHSVQIDNEGGPSIVRCFSLIDGNRLMQTKAPGGLFLVDKQWKQIAKPTAGTHNWHGTWSIDQNTLGTVIYGDYTTLGGPVSLWRSADGGRSFAAVLTAPGVSSREAGAVRHFHTCQADPFEPGRWIASSGDAGNHIRQWVSGDDGITWSELAPNLRPSKLVPSGAERRVFRRTAEIYDEKSLYWVSDDDLGAKIAVLVTAPRTQPQAARVVDSVGNNCGRSLISLGPGLALSIAESKDDLRGADVYFVDLAQGALPLERVPNPTERVSGFTASLTSKAANGGTFFAFEDGLLDAESRGTRWTVEFSDVPLPEMAGALAQNLPHLEPAREVLDRAFRCNLCDKRLQKLANQRHYHKIRHRPERGKIKTSGGARVEYLCPMCNSRARTRVLEAYFHEFAKSEWYPGRGNALVVCAVRRERRLIEPYFDSLTHVSLQGDHGDPDCQVGIDITAMPSIPTGGFRFAFACGVLDYIPEVRKVFTEMRRVLQPGGVFMFYIQPWRVVEREVQVQVVNTNALSYEDYAVMNEKQESGIPDCVFGRRWLFEMMIQEGFIPEQKTLYDPFGHIVLPWFLARRME